MNRTIRNVTLYPLTTQRRYGRPSQHIVVRLDGAGLSGWGEMSDLSHLPAMMPDLRDLECCLRVLLIGRDPIDTNGIEDLMLLNFPGSRFYGKACLVRAGISIAAHDLKARILGIPLSDLLGGARRTRIPVCYPIFRLKDRADVPGRCELVKQQLDRGFTRFRFYFGLDSDADEAFLESVFASYGGLIELVALDGSGMFTVPGFLRAYRRLCRFPFQMIESPVHRDDVDSIAEARRAIDHPISEHVESPEYGVRLIRAHAVDIFNISVTVAGGIEGMLRLFALAHSANRECVVGTTQELSLATAAQAHVGAVTPKLDYASDPVGPALYCADVVREPVRYEAGDLLVPTGLGLGVEVDFDRVQAMAAPLSAADDAITSLSRG
ncbi:MAG: hypothetical protein HUU41_02185 [Bryobacteraceae bacterium]|nr:hypothetical protein [Bryobacterales bacterium]MEB2363080.1 hypothetical protein [Bryobacterales bacterium]NUM99898.1 hypothetical protein [Bryobacteraceae bacterium]